MTQQIATNSVTSIKAHSASWIGGPARRCDLCGGASFLVGGGVGMEPKCEECLGAALSGAAIERGAVRLLAVQSGGRLRYRLDGPNGDGAGDLSPGCDASGNALPALVLPGNRRVALDPADIWDEAGKRKPLPRGWQESCVVYLGEDVTC